MEPIVYQGFMVVMGIVHLALGLRNTDAQRFIQADLWIVGSLIVGALT